MIRPAAIAYDRPAAPPSCDVERARALIARAEAALGPLSDGMARDLLADHTDWTLTYIAHVVLTVRPPVTRPACIVLRHPGGAIGAVYDLRLVERDARPGMARLGWRDWYAIAREEARAGGYAVSVERGA